MTSTPRTISFPLFCLATLALCPSARAGEYGGEFRSETARCSVYGPEFTAASDEDCAHIGGRIRVQLGATAGLSPDTGWGANKASSATLHPNGAAPQTATPSHLRVQGGLEYPNPFR